MTRLIAITLLCLALAVPGAARAGSLDAEQTKAVEQIVHDYLMKHPEVLLEAMQAAADKDKADKDAQAQATVKKHHAEIYDDRDTPIGGNPKGDVTVVEFFDYRCPYCKQVQPSLEKLIDADSKVRIIYKEFPILGPASTYATKMALASRAQGKYADFHRAMMAAKGTIDDKVVDRVAGSVGIDVARAKRDMNAPAIQAVIDRDLALADAIAVNGTPSFVIADKLYSGSMSLDELKKLIAEARQAHAG